MSSSLVNSIPRLVSTACAVIAIALAGCKSDEKTATYYRPLPPKPRPLAPAPPDARANAMVLNVSATPMDTNGNGYPDLIHATAHLFDRRYPPAIYEDGAFAFAMFAPGELSLDGAQPIHEWIIADVRLQESRSRSVFGDCYRFRLSLLEDDGTDRLEVPIADLVCVFHPADGGEPTWSGEVATIQVGQRVRVPGMRWREITDPETDGGAWP